MRKILSLTVVVLLSVSAFAGIEDDIQKLVGENATSYIHPLTNGIGVTMNSGWYNSSKSYSFFKLPFGIQAYFGEGISVVDDDLKSYQFKGAVATANLGLSGFNGLPDTLRMNVADAPTAVGAKTGSVYTMETLLRQNLDMSNAMNIAALNAMSPEQKNQVLLTMPGGLDMDMLPGVPPVVGVNIGLPFKAQLGIRYLPPLKIPKFGEISQLGIKAQYEFTQWIPVVGKLPMLHTSAMYAFNNLNLFDIMKLNNWTTMVNASMDFKFLVGLGVYTGFGIESSTMSLDYTVPADAGPGLAGTKVDLEDEGDNFMKALVGVRVSFLVFDLYADATFAATNSYHVGIALGLNGL